MRILIAAGAALALAVSAVVADENCSGNSQEINGNWYCSAVKEMEYDVFGKPGSYMEVTNMDPETGECTQQSKEYSGAMAPFHEGCSFHFRGPLKLKQFAVYKPNANDAHAKRSAPVAHQRRHAHQHFHKHKRDAHKIQEHVEHEKRAVGDMVYATIDGKVESWKNDYAGGAAAPPATSSAAEPVTTSDAPSNPTPSSVAPLESSTSAAPSPQSSSGSEGSSTGDWVRSGYYDASSSKMEGLVMLNNKGGQGSGVFDYKFGNSLSYASSNGQNGAPSPQILDGEAVLPSNNEVIFFSDKKCEGDDCGYVRPGTVAYHGFDGAEKAFFIEFQMPNDGNSGSAYDNANMPSIWLLNAKIPRTGQYVKETCSCWKSGCGEFDIFEVLDPGNTRCKSTVHSNDAVGHSDYFERPVDKTIKVVVIFTGSENKAHIKVLDDSTTFSSSMSTSQMKDFYS